MSVTFTDTSFRLLADLVQNNSRDWYQAHRSEFTLHVLDPFAQLLEGISAKLIDHHMDFRGGRNTMFRMNRDTRFSKDKSPYKTSVSGLLTPSGEKRERTGFIYLQLDTSGGFAAFGRYGLDAKALGPIRDRIIAEADAFELVLEGLNENRLDLLRDNTLKGMPRGYAEHADHRFAAELKLTNMIVRDDLTLTAWHTGDVLPRVSDTALACRNFISFVSV
ncbi:MAG: DUF2461 domain-containing protein [Pseudomonadota bacterium]